MENTGEIKRYDQRDAFAYRSQLIPGSKEYEVYYTQLHPEFKEMDEKVRIHYDDMSSHKRRLEIFPEETLGAAWVYGTKKNVVYLLKNAVDGPVNPERIKVDPAEISRKIKGLAKYLGAGIVGIGELNQAWVYSHVGHPGGDWGKPINLNHKYAIVMGFPHTWDLWLTEATAGIPGYMDDWNYYHNMSVTSVRLAAAIRDMGYPARAHIQSNYACLMPPLAVDAGLGEQCLIGICLTKEYGLAYRLNAVTTDLPLIPDPPSRLGIEDFCNKCSKCIDACPSGALSQKDKITVNGRMVWKQDVYKCFRYWNAKGVSCSICRRACPWSKPGTAIHRAISTMGIKLPALRSAMIKADDIIYGKKPRSYPPPAWLQNGEEKMSFGKRLLYRFDHL